ncbi:protein Shroom2 isoform X3 [Ascaphus truei]|uniref:protein Shroom2 isoform X3 n=1 Tax=Ascaphus truei TaxID=8439 RepID=UPI003F59A5C9
METRGGGQERFFPDKDVRLNPGLVDQGQMMMVERKTIEGYRLVEVLLTGGAPWGFTLKGGREHREPLIITKVEDGNKAADTLMAGDEIVNINDFPLSGYRQEAICLVKGSHKTLKMVVKRKMKVVVVDIIKRKLPPDNDVLVARSFLTKILRSSMRRNDAAYRPHSWHSTKFTESASETPQLSNSNVNSSWNSRYHSSSSSHDLSNPWDQTNLQRNSGHFSSMGSMDSIDQTYQFGRLSSAKSNNSIDHLGNQSKRDSAYGSFSTSFIPRDPTMSNTGSASTENLLYKINEWDTAKLGHRKTSPFLIETRGPEDKQGYQSPSILNEANKMQRTDDFADSRQSGRSNFGPVWYVPDKKKTSSPPPPPPPLRSDSFAATKSHEKTTGSAQSDITNSQHFTVANRSQSRPDRNSETSDYQQRLVRVTDRTLADMRRISSSSYQVDINLDQGVSSCNDKYHNNALNAGRLQSSLSSNDIRFAQPTYNYHHQRQYSDESTFFQNAKASTSHEPQQKQMSFYTGVHELSTDPVHVYNPHQVRISSSSTSSSGGKQKVDNSGQNRFYCVTAKQPPQGTTQQEQFKEEYSKTETSSELSSALFENAVTSPQKSSSCLPPHIRESSPEHCEKNGLKITAKRDGHLSNNGRIIHKKNIEYFEQCNDHSFPQQDNSENSVLTNELRSHQKEYRWGEEERNKITPQKTPMLHSLAQEGRNRSDSFPETGKEKQPFLDISTKQSRRSDRFATTLRNEIQVRRARMQKSKSTAALTELNESEDSENWNQDSFESVNPTSDGSFSSTYKNHLQEAQARVLRATSFKRRDLEPGLTDHPPVSPDDRIQGYNYSMSALSPEDCSFLTNPAQPKLNTTVNSSQNMSRIGGRKRFTTQQKLRSYSEPEKMNEVGIYEDDHHFHSPNTSREVVGSFADRRKFFEETSKSMQPKHTPKLTLHGQPEEKCEKYSNKDYDNDSGEPWLDERVQEASLGLESPPDSNRRPTNHYHYVGHKIADNVTFEQPQRLGTFAEYQASWKEQKKPLERKNSGRCHSADNILDSDIEQKQKSQYIHGRSRSSPTTDFYAQGAIVDPKKQVDSARDDSENASLTRCSNNTGSSSARIVEIVEKEDPSRGKADIIWNTKWKPHGKPSQIREVSYTPQENRARSGTLPNDYRYINENVKQEKIAGPIPETHSGIKNYSHAEEDNQWLDQTSVNRKRGPAPQRPPPPKVDHKYRRQNDSTSSLATSSESLLTTQAKSVHSYSPSSLDVVISQPALAQSPVVYPEKHLHDTRFSASLENDNRCLERKLIDSEPAVSSKSNYLQKPGMEPSRSPSPQFAPQKLTDKPPLLAQIDNMSRIERVIDNTKVKMVPIKIIHSESHAEKESRHNLLSAIEPPALLSGLARDQLKTLSTSEQSYSRFCAYTRHDPEDQSREADNQPTQELVENTKESDVSSLTVSYSKSKDKIYNDVKSEELVKEIIGKDKSLAEILDPTAKMRTTMDLMEGIFPKDDHLLEEAQQRRKLLPKVPSPRPSEEKKDEQNMSSAISLTTSSTYYSTSAPKAELLNKMKDMQEQQHPEEDSEEELDHDLSVKKQELIDSISKKLQVLREAKETLLEDIQCNNALGEEVEVIVKEVCKPNEFDKFRMFIGDLEKIVNLLLSLSGRLARVENALNNLDETVTPEERRTLVEKRKLLTRQHEDAKELKENLDRRERIVFDILASYLNEENIADYEHFVKMKSALILEQRELEDKIKLGEEQLKCLTDSLPSDRIK